MMKMVMVVMIMMMVAVKSHPSPITVQNRGLKLTDLIMIMMMMAMVVMVVMVMAGHEPNFGWVLAFGSVIRMIMSIMMRILMVEKNVGEVDDVDNAEDEDDVPGNH